MKKYTLFLLIIILPFYIFGQEISNDTISRTATIKANVIGNSVLLTPETPTLNQIAGAPKAFYTHYWEMGDGSYSKEETPKGHANVEKGCYW